MGIEPQFLPYVFDRFRQADSTSTRKYGGLGLGLAIVRHVVEMHGGTVAASSPGKGQGSTFKVRFPIASPDILLQAAKRPPGAEVKQPMQPNQVDDKAKPAMASVYWLSKMIWIRSRCSKSFSKIAAPR